MQPLPVRSAAVKKCVKSYMAASSHKAADRKEALILVQSGSMCKGTTCSVAVPWGSLQETPSLPQRSSA